MSKLTNRKDHCCRLYLGRRRQFPPHFCCQVRAQCICLGHSISVKCAHFSFPRAHRRDQESLVNSFGINETETLQRSDLCLKLKVVEGDQSQDGLFCHIEEAWPLAYQQGTCFQQAQDFSSSYYRRPQNRSLPWLEVPEAVSCRYQARGLVLAHSHYPHRRAKWEVILAQVLY